MALTNASNEVVNTYAYSPYGMVLNEDQSVNQPFKYAGQAGIFTEDDNLYYMRARYYDAEVGRFISEDPAGFVDGPNLYAYVGGNPIAFLDPSGQRRMGQPRVADNDGPGSSDSQTSINVTLLGITWNFGSDGFNHIATPTTLIGVTVQINNPNQSVPDGSDQFSAGLNYFGNGLYAGEDGYGLTLGLELGLPVSIGIDGNKLASPSSSGQMGRKNCP